MVYHKDKDKKYTDLCKEFDAEFYAEDRDDAKLFKTMYLVYYMLASKSKFFKNVNEYDEYAMFAATTIYMRFIKKQKQGERIKSLLNYAKNTKNFLKQMYQSENYKQDSYEINKKDYLFVGEMRRKLRDIVQQDYRYDIREQVEKIVNSLSDIVHRVVMRTPYKKNKYMIKNLEMSCKLTLLSQLTLSTKNINKLTKKEDKNKEIDYSLIYKYLNEEKEDVICWRISDDLSDYVKLLVNKIRKELSTIIYNTKHSYELPDDVLDSVLCSAYAKDDVITGEEY